MKMPAVIQDALLVGAGALLILVGPEAEGK